nr:ribonuclease R [Lachnospiraceae bacterium]
RKVFDLKKYKEKTKKAFFTKGGKIERKRSEKSLEKNKSDKKKENNLLVRGVFSGTERGFGFVTIEGREEDIFIPEKYTLDAFNKDTVLVEITAEAEGSKRCEGKIVKTEKHEVTGLTGVFEKSKHYGFVIPDDKRFGSDIFISKEHTKGAVNGSRVYCKITDYGKHGKSPEGRITELLGHINDPSTDTLSVIRAYGIEPEFTMDAAEQANSLPQELSEKDYTGRCDLRDLVTVTIDGEDAKDLDDAISITRTDNGYELGVHIADVSNYVTEDSPLDINAAKRGTSVYLINSVVPMLPFALSNGICSLNEGVDRLALSCIMDISKKGEIVGHKIVKSVINSNRRMSYNEVMAYYNKQADFGILNEKFDLMLELSKLLREKRRSRGAVDFDIPETKVTVDENGRPVKIGPYDRTDATRLIEDFMLAANETVAEDHFWQEIPFVYRIHDDPDAERIKQLKVFVKNFGLTIKGSKDGEVHPGEIQKLLDDMGDNEEAPLISRLVLRSMKQAVYSTECSGHFGLAARYYCHFTSPIRRYPDLLIHRIIKENLDGKLTDERKEHYAEILDELALSSSKAERNADEAEREVIKRKMAEYMEMRIGQIYNGVISGVTGRGFFVELTNTVEGFVSLEDLTDDYYKYDADNYTLTGERSRKVFKLGQHLKVTVMAVDKVLRSITFLPYAEN